MALTYGRKDWLKFSLDVERLPLRGRVSLGSVLTRNEESASVLAEFWRSLADPESRHTPSVEGLSAYLAWYTDRGVGFDPDEYGSDALQTAASIAASLWAAILYLDPEFRP